MPTKVIETKMTRINSDSVKKRIRAKGYNLTDMAAYLQPYYEFREDAYHHFKYWLKVGRMPTDKYRLMCEVLDGTV